MLAGLAVPNIHIYMRKTSMKINTPKTTDFNLIDIF